MATRYMHLINGQPCVWDKEHKYLYTVLVSGIKVSDMAKSLKEIRRQQVADRKQHPISNPTYTYIRVYT